MHLRNNGAIVSAWVAALALSLGCASQKSNTDEEAAKAARQADFIADRREFTRAARERLDELNDEIIVLAVNIQQHGTDPQQTEWGERLFRLKQERNRLDTALLGASEATETEWSDLHAELSQEIKVLEKDVNQAANEVIQDLTAAHAAHATPPPGPSEVDLCEVQVNGTAAEVQQQGELVIVQLTAPTPEAVAELQARAEELSANGSGSSAAGQGSAQGTSMPLAIHLQVSEIDNGVVFVFTPAEGQLAALTAQLEKEAELIENKRC